MADFLTEIKTKLELMNINKRVFTGSCVPLGTPLGVLLMNSKESKEISKAISKIKIYNYYYLTNLTIYIHPNFQCYKCKI